MRILHESYNGRNSHALGCQASYTILGKTTQALHSPGTLALVQSFPACYKGMDGSRRNDVDFRLLMTNVAAVSQAHAIAEAKRCQGLLGRWPFSWELLEAWELLEEGRRAAARGKISLTILQGGKRQWQATRK